MPKLDTKTARRVNKAETGGGPQIPPGQYLATLREVKVSPKKDKNGNEYWIWTFELDEGSFKGSKIRTNTGLSENQDFWMKTVFEAFGAKLNVDTDTLYGKQVLLTIDQSEIQAGSRKGQIRSEITTLGPPEEEGDEEDEFDEEGESDESEDDEDDDDEF